MGWFWTLTLHIKGTASNKKPARQGKAPGGLNSGLEKHCCNKRITEDVELIYCGTESW